MFKDILKDKKIFRHKEMPRENIKVKVCGIRDFAEAACLIEHGVWAMGEVFAVSPRRIEVEAAAKLNHAIGKKLVKIGVFVNENISELQNIAKECRLDLIQLHGDESPEYIEELNYPVIKAIAVDKELDIEKVKRWRAWAYLFDTHSPHLRGGSGEVFNWDYLKQLSALKRVILAGGISADNVLMALNSLSFLNIMAVDLSSSLERPEGGKDEKKIIKFMEKMSKQRV